ncbi:Secretory carrier-associated membrane protein 5 [Hibiscus syriacus]|uniref:Secretory carrier-associated membrane protein n=1 Tax=Hibiscus syriacus TaxID=106335 RepID=A0A6A2XR84_HIBSY|nr:Secretory carrier-associated membrane protein 5 [Hibiscus syriacus]
MSHVDTNPFAEEEVNPFAVSSFAPPIRLSILFFARFDRQNVCYWVFDHQEHQNIKQWWHIGSVELEFKQLEWFQTDEVSMVYQILFKDEFIALPSNYFLSCWISCNVSLVNGLLSLAYCVMFVLCLRIEKEGGSIERAGIVIEVKTGHHFFLLSIMTSQMKYQSTYNQPYVAFATLIGLVICLLYNIAAATAAWIKGYGLIFGFLPSYTLTGIPGGFYLWYSPLYKAVRTDSALRFGSFFLGYSCHILFCILAAVAPELFFGEGSITGILAALDLFTQNRALGIIYFVGFGLFICESLVSIWVIQQVFMYFRGSGKAAEMKREAARRTMSQH